MTITKDPLVPICSTHLQPQVLTNLLFVSRHSPAWTYHINGIIKYAAFLSGFFTYHNAFEIHSCYSITTSFLLLNSIPLF